MAAEPPEMISGPTCEQVTESLREDRNPRNIRACLPPADRDYRLAMARATEELNLAPVHELVAHWWHIARMKATGEYEQIVHLAVHVEEQIENGEHVESRPLRDVLAERAAELGVTLDL